MTLPDLSPIASSAAAPPRTPNLQPPVRLLMLPAEHEPAWLRRLGLGLAIAVTLGCFLLIHAYFAPAPGIPGIDENAYLVAGGNIAEHFSPGMHPANPYAYVSMMWIRTPDGWYYPKYPAGVPLLNAIIIWLSGSKFLAFYLSPLCASLAIPAMFLLTRRLAGSFLALLAGILLATNATLLQLALVPSSHAPAICFALWGMVFLLWWCQSGRLWLGIAGGFLLGYTATIRYSEGLLLLPLVAAAICVIRWTHWRSYLRAAVPLVAWAVPVGSLVAFNYAATGHFTGYDSSHESTGFTLTEFLSKWEFTAQQLYLYGLFLVLPVGLAGMSLMFQRSWRVALILALWFVPSLLLYTAYYWGTQAPGIGFLRFFLTLYPPVIAAAMWLLAVAARGARPEPSSTSTPSPLRRTLTLALVALPITACAGAAGVYVALPDMAHQYTHNANLAFSAREILKVIPAHPNPARPQPMVFTDQGIFPQIIMYMQFVGDAEWYSADAFSVNGGLNLGIMSLLGGNGAPDAGDANQETPVLLPPERFDSLRALYNGKDRGTLIAEQNRVMADALDHGRPVYAILTPNAAREFRRKFITEGFDATVIAHWQEPIPHLEDPPAPTNRFGGPPRSTHSNALAPPRIPIGLVDSGPRLLQILQITRKPSTTATQP